MMDIYNRRISVQWVCGIAFFIIALTSIVVYLKNSNELSTAPLQFAGDVLILIVAIPIMINSKIKASLAAALMSISFGIACVLQDWELMNSGVSEVHYYLLLLLLILGAATAIFGVGLLFGYKYHGERLKFVVIISLAAICVPILLRIRDGIAMDDLWSLIKQSLPSVCFLVLLFITLFSPEIRFYTAYNRLLKNVIYIREVFSVAKDSWIYRSDLKRLMNYKNEEWTPVGGPIVEEQVYIVHIYKSTLRMMIQRWDNGTVRLKIAQNRTDVIMDKINMQLMEIIPDGDADTCESFTIFGTDGIFIRLLVKEDKVTKKSKKQAEKMMKELEPGFESGEE